MQLRTGDFFSKSVRQTQENELWHLDPTRVDVPPSTIHKSKFSADGSVTSDISVLTARVLMSQTSNICSLLLCSRLIFARSTSSTPSGTNWSASSSISSMSSNSDWLLLGGLEDSFQIESSRIQASNSKLEALLTFESNRKYGSIWIERTKQ